MILEEVSNFNASSAQYKSFLMHSESLLHQMESKVKAMKSEEPHYF